jgi:WhiB family redox-sensing transcriptional regulator
VTKPLTPRPPLPCTGQGDLFFRESDRRGNVARTHRAKRLCARCPVWEACRQLGRDTRSYGIWGGEDEDQRTRAGFKPAHRTLPAPCGTEAGAKRHGRDGEKACGPCLKAANTAKENRRKNLATAA